MGMLDGKKLLLTGVVNRDSIAYEVAMAGARVVVNDLPGSDDLADTVLLP